METVGVMCMRALAAITGTMVVEEKVTAWWACLVMAMAGPEAILQADTVALNQVHGINQDSGKL